MNGRLCAAYVDTTEIPQLVEIADRVNVHAGLRLPGTYVPFHIDEEDESFEELSPNDEFGSAGVVEPPSELLIGREQPGE